MARDDKARATLIRDAAGNVQPGKSPRAFAEPLFGPAFEVGSGGLRQVVDAERADRAVRRFDEGLVGAAAERCFGRQAARQRHGQ